MLISSPKLSPLSTYVPHFLLFFWVYRGSAVVFAEEDKSNMRGHGDPEVCILSQMMHLNIKWVGHFVRQNITMCTTDYRTRFLNKASRILRDKKQSYDSIAPLQYVLSTFVYLQTEAFAQIDKPEPCRRQPCHACETDCPRRDRAFEEQQQSSSTLKTG